MSFRINKCIVGYSRRQADALVENGRVKVNGKVAQSAGVKINFGDSISVDNQPIQWESYVKQVYGNKENNHGSTVPSSSAQQKNRQLFSTRDGFLYMKMWKPMNTVTTTAGFDKESIIRYIYQNSSPSQRSLLPSLEKRDGRIFPVGRLDKDTTGLILLTSNPRFQYELLGNKDNKAPIPMMDVISSDEEEEEEEEDDLDWDLVSYKDENSGKDNSVCESGMVKNKKKPVVSFSPTVSSSNLTSINNPFYEKVYEVTLDKPASKEALDAWRSGMVITSSTTTRKKIVSPTRPCVVTPLTRNLTNAPDNYVPGKSFLYQFILQEGRNRQLHRMMNAFGYEILHIHRTKFCQITLDGLKQPGDWKTLNNEELKLICGFVQR